MRMPYSTVLSGPQQYSWYHKYSLGTRVCKGTGLKACQLLKAAAADELSDSAADSSPSCARKYWQYPLRRKAPSDCRLGPQC